MVVISRLRQQGEGVSALTINPATGQPHNRPITIELVEGVKPMFWYHTLCFGDEPAFRNGPQEAIMQLGARIKLFNCGRNRQYLDRLRELVEDKPPPATQIYVVIPRPEVAIKALQIAGKLEVIGDVNILAHRGYLIPAD
jgi:hypothetical protein